MAIRNCTVGSPANWRSVVAYHRAGWIRGHVLFKLNLSDDLLWGLPPSAEAIEVYLGLVPEDLPHSWMTYTYGPSVWAQCEVAIERGGHVRVGIGDNPVEADGSIATNVEHVQRAVALARRMGREVASPTEALAILGARSLPDRASHRSARWAFNPSLARGDARQP